MGVDLKKSVPKRLFSEIYVLSLHPKNGQLHPRKCMQPLTKL